MGIGCPMSSDAERPAMSDDPDGDVGREDQEAPGNFVDDPDAREVPEPNEPG